MSEINLNEYITYWTNAGEKLNRIWRILSLNPNTKRSTGLFADSRFAGRCRPLAHFFRSKKTIAAITK
jgi:hypothetical protein